ncbi:hypothetical protein [Moraxella oblonga]|uniref:hypothetical protein n=1 Tax=Moraxella oblonga TaxID=200413 RepID=UPI00082F2334|nr:hypothetical protein [Moraxella oblonga]
MLTLPPNTQLSKTTISAMASTALEFSEDVVKSTNPILIAGFERIEKGESTHEEEIAKVIDNFLKYGKIDG